MVKKLFHIFWHLTLAVYVLGQTGFTSIDCGSEELKYDDPSTGISFTSDSIYIEAGVNNVIGNPSLPKPYQTIRSFPTGKRNCYSLEGVNIGDKYLVRASFMYGNYDGLNKLPEFDIYLGVDLWLSVKFDNSSHMLWSEIIIAARTTSIDVCLLNKDSGTPFISILEFRRWRSAMYNPIFEVNSVLVTFKRVDTGSSKAFRYPEDSYDRIWSPDSSSKEEHPSWKILTSTNDVNGTLDEFDVPKAVMQTAVESNSSKYPIDISWSGNPSSEFHVVGYFSELVDGLNLSREISIYINNEVPFSFVLPTFGETYVDFSLSPLSGLSNHTYSVTATNIAPLLNAFEIFQVRQLSRLATSLEDVSAIMSIKQTYDIRRNWKGDPCLPKDYPWIGLGCNYDNATNPRIISLDLSMSNLTGDISDILSTLTAIKSINLANNSLRGSIPDSLGDLPNLEYLYLEGNQLNGAIPEKLKERINNGTLKLRIDDHMLISKKSHRGLVVGIVITAAVSLIVLVVVILAIKLKIRKQGDETGEDDGGEKNSEFSLFSFAMVEAATDNFSFENKLGEGGFGPVYKGVMPDGHEIAVKRLSQSSGQGTVEFKNEAELTAKLQHRNLVRLLGYCTHGEEKILIYEYMPNKSLDSFLFDPNKSALLDWTKRLNIIIGIARGILYLHEDSRLRIIHRDLKSSNILLDAEMSPKISDFGMARSFGRHQSQENTRNVVGTYGYMSPEYALRGFFSEKSDIFSFGVLVLEIVSGKKSNGFYNEFLSLIGYGWQLWKEGRAKEFMDPCLGDSYPMWEVLRCIHIGLLCVQESPRDRPNMSSILFMLSSETDLVPPEKPAYSILSEADIASIQQKMCSANNVTITEIEAR